MSTIFREFPYNRIVQFLNLITVRFCERIAKIEKRTNENI